MEVIWIGLKPRTRGERGLPKHGVPQAKIATSGLVGDYNVSRETKMAGEPERAVLVIEEVILEELRREGWPLKAGDLGENLTLRGARKGDLRLGSRVCFPSGAEIEIRRVAEPCRKLGSLPWVGDRKVVDFVRATIGRRGWHCAVIQAGSISLGDAAFLSPAGGTRRQEKILKRRS